MNICIFDKSLKQSQDLDVVTAAVAMSLYPNS